MVEVIKGKRNGIGVEGAFSTQGRNYVEKGKNYLAGRCKSLAVKKMLA